MSIRYALSPICTTRHFLLSSNSSRAVYSGIGSIGGASALSASSITVSFRNEAITDPPVRIPPWIEKYRHTANTRNGKRSADIHTAHGQCVTVQNTRSLAVWFRCRSSRHQCKPFKFLQPTHVHFICAKLQCKTYNETRNIKDQASCKQWPVVTQNLITCHHRFPVQLQYSLINIRKPKDDQSEDGCSITFPVQCWSEHGIRHHVVWFAELVDVVIMQGRVVKVVGRPPSVELIQVRQATGRWKCYVKVKRWTGHDLPLHVWRAAAEFTGHWFYGRQIEIRRVVVVSGCNWTSNNGTQGIEFTQ